MHTHTATYVLHHTAMQHMQVMSRLHFTRFVIGTLFSAYIRHTYRVYIQTDPTRVKGLTGYPCRNRLHFTWFVIGWLLTTPPPLSSARPPSTFCPISPSSPVLPISPSSSFLTKATHARTFAFRPFPSCPPPTIPALFASLHSLLLRILLLSRHGFPLCFWIFAPFLPSETPGELVSQIWASFLINVSRSSSWGYHLINTIIIWYNLRSTLWQTQKVYCVRANPRHYELESPNLLTEFSGLSFGKRPQRRGLFCQRDLLHTRSKAICSGNHE